MNRQKLFFLGLLLICIFAGLFYSSYVYNNVKLDGISIYYPSLNLIHNNRLNMWNDLNDRYDTYYFKLPFTDEVIKDKGHSYPQQLPINILYYSFIISFFGNYSFFYISIFSAVLILFFLGLLVKNMTSNTLISLVVVIVVAIFPIYIFWAILPQTIMLTTLFFIVSLFCITEFIKTSNRLLLFLAFLYFELMILTKPTMILAIPIFLLVPNIKEVVKKNLLLIVMTFCFVFGFFIAFNIIYFSDPLFLGYLRADYHPVSISNDFSPFPKITDRFWIFGETSAIIKTIFYFIEGVFTYYSLIILFIISSILGLIYKKNHRKVILLFMIISIFLLLYNSSIEPNLWKPTTPEFKFSLSLAFFRYLLPVFIIIIIGGTFYLNIISNNYLRPKNKLFLILLVFLIISTTIPFYILKTINYEHGTSLNWYREFNLQLINYSTKANLILKRESIILIPERLELTFLYPNVSKYKFFYYDGIPPRYRINETTRIVKSLLLDNHTIYIGLYDEPYLSSILQKSEGDPNIREIVESLSREFQIIPLNETYFNRMKFKFAELKLENENSNNFE